jgi:carbon monoxide dehydrogenase subunit G
MRFEGTLDIDASRERVWEFLTDPAQVTQCAPDLQSLDVADPHHFTVLVRAGVGPIRGMFTMNVQFIELHRPNHAVVLARGHAPGSAIEMTSSMNLSESDATRTVMEWSSDVTVSGKVAQVGARFMQGAADKITQQVFACIKTKLEASTVET